MSRLLNKEFLIFLFFLILSSVFWLLMTLNETYEKELRIPMRLTATPHNVVVTAPMADTLRVTVRDKGYLLMGYSLGQQLRPLSINFNTYANKQTGHGAVPTQDLQKMVKQQLASSTTITQIKADQLDFYFNYGRKKRVRVQLVGNITPARNHYLSHVEIWPETVTVYANENQLDSIKAVQTEYLNIINFDDTVVSRVRLKAIRGVKMEPAMVVLKLFPDVLTEESCEVPIRTINKPDELIIRTFPQRVRVHFTIGASMYRYVKPSDFAVVVDYREIASHPSDKCNLYVTSKPQGVSNVRLEATQVDYLIEHR